MPHNHNDSDRREKTMPPQTDPAENDRRTVFGLDRRHVLQAIGAGVGLSALSGLGQARIAQSDGMISDDMISYPDVTRQAEPADAIDPVFGFAAASSDVTPPVEPDHEVQMLIQPRDGAPIPEFFFQPTGLFIEPGDVVQFTATTPHHNVVAYHPAFGYVPRVPDGVPPFSAPVFAPSGYWLYRFDVPGVYEMNCAPHEVFGMVIRLVVGEPTGPAAEPLPDLCHQPAEPRRAEGEHPEEARLPPFTAYTVLRDSALNPERIVEQGSVAWDELCPSSKQLFIKPVGFPPCGDGGM